MRAGRLPAGGTNLRPRIASAPRGHSHLRASLLSARANDHTPPSPTSGDDGERRPQVASAPTARLADSVAGGTTPSTARTAPRGSGSARPPPCTVHPAAVIDRLLAALPLAGQVRLQLRAAAQQPKERVATALLLRVVAIRAAEAGTRGRQTRRLRRPDVPELVREGATRARPRSARTGGARCTRT